MDWINPPNKLVRHMAEREVEVEKAVVASPHRLASEAGVKILRKGGNAIDAAVATSLALGVVAPGWSGLGGGGFIIARMIDTQETVAIDYRETAPAHLEKYRLGPNGEVEDDANSMGYKAVAVPGTLAGLSLALNEHGTMSMKEVLEPAIEYAENGFEVTRFWDGCVKLNLDHALDKLSRFPETAKTLLRTKNKHFYEPGERMVLEDLGKTLRKIVDDGHGVFYDGAIADFIATDMAANGGWVTREDLVGYRAEHRNPVIGTYMGYEIMSMPPPGSGGTLIQILNILEGFNLKGHGHNTSETIHIIAEAMKLAFADRERYVADPDFVSIPTKTLTSKEYAEKLRQEIGLDKTTIKVAPHRFDADHVGQTAHISVIDSEGNMVSLTETLECFLGSGVTILGTGICMNDEMHDFNLTTKTPNSIKPNKRPLSSMSPTLILKDGSPFMVLGSTGGPRIITSMIQVIINVIDFGMRLQRAIESPRFHCKHDRIYVESRIPENVRRGLRRMGHKVIVRKRSWPFRGYDLFYGGVQAILYDQKTSKVYGGADPRKDGAARGY